MSPPAGREASKKNPGRRPERPCFLCLAPDCESLCPHCRAVYYCGEEHFRLHRLPDADYCFPYEADHMDGVGKRPSRMNKGSSTALSSFQDEF